MGSIDGNDVNFCVKYLGNKEMFPMIEMKTIERLCYYEFDCFETLISLNFDLDLPLIEGINLGQKALVRKALTLLSDEYINYCFDYNNEIELKSVFDRIRDKVNIERNGCKLSDINIDINNKTIDENNCINNKSANALKTKDLNVININEDLNFTLIKSNSFDDKLSENNRSVNEIKDREESELEANDDEEVEEELSECEDEEDDDIEVDDTDWLKFKTNTDKEEYERLRKSVDFESIVLIKRCD